jgi:hypothetical protein
MAGYPWSQGRVKYLLTNVVYKGDYLSHKTVCIVPGKQVKNAGHRDQFYITGHHEPIVSTSLFDRVQKIVVNGDLISLRRRKERRSA